MCQMIKVFRCCDEKSCPCRYGQYINAHDLSRIPSFDTLKKMIDGYCLSVISPMRNVHLSVCTHYGMIVLIHTLGLPVDGCEQIFESLKSTEICDFLLNMFDIELVHGS
jgi:hypothetical protein